VTASSLALGELLFLLFVLVAATVWAIVRDPHPKSSVPFVRSAGAKIAGVLLVVPLVAVAAATCSRERGQLRGPNPMTYPFSGGTPQCGPHEGTTLHVRAKDITFLTADNSGPVGCLSVLPGTAFRLVFANDDRGVVHDVAIIRGPRMYSFNPPTLFRSPEFPGVRTESYPVEAMPAGMWTFHCDLHPDAMEGAFIVPIAIDDGGFALAAAQVRQGFAMSWWVSSSDARGHGVRDASGVLGGRGGALDSGMMPPGRSYYFRFFGAGTYPLVDPATGHRSRIEVPVNVIRSASGSRSEITVQWSFDDNPRGFISDVQILRPGSTRWTGFAWGQRVGRTEFRPDAGPGEYAFRARFRRMDGGGVTGWSPAVRVALR
jgi:hypothetical protein